jgi:pyridoxamine 5'-phosphate oxidase
MTKDEVFEFIKANPVCAFATARDNRPFVRMIMLYRADENGIIFTTGENKDMHRQLKENPQVELCFYNSEQGKQVRVSGTAEVFEDMELKKQVVKDYPFLQEWVDREGYEVLVVYCVDDGVATPWTMETNFKQKEYIEL